MKVAIAAAHIQIPDSGFQTDYFSTPLQKNKNKNNTFPEAQRVTMVQYSI